MRFHKTPLEGAYRIELDKRGDDRGFFARVFCESEFGEAGLETRFVQANNSFTLKKGALRGLHYQLPPAAEVIDQQITGEGCQPGRETSPRKVETCQISVDLEKDFLGEVFGIMGRTSKAVAEAVDAPVLRPDQFRPGR